MSSAISAFVRSKEENIYHVSWSLMSSDLDMKAAVKKKLSSTVKDSFVIQLCHMSHSTYLCLRARKRQLTTAIRLF